MINSFEFFALRKNYFVNCDWQIKLIKDGKYPIFIYHNNLKFYISIYGVDEPGSWTICTTKLYYFQYYCKYYWIILENLSFYTKIRSLVIAISVSLSIKFYLPIFTHFIFFWMKLLHTLITIYIFILICLIFLLFFFRESRTNLLLNPTQTFPSIYLSCSLCLLKRARFVCSMKKTSNWKFLPKWNAAVPASRAYDGPVIRGSRSTTTGSWNDAHMWSV